MIGGWQRGSLTPQGVTFTAAASAPTATRAAQTAARCTAAKSLNRKDIDQSIGSHAVPRRRAFAGEPRAQKGGPQVPSLWSPSLLAAQVGSSATRGGREGPAKGSELESRSAYRTRRIVPRAAADLERTGPLRRRTTAAGNLTGTNRSDG
jgi:hypothetical protein